MKNYKQPGEILTLTAPGGGVVSGLTYLVGALIVVAQNSAAAGETFGALVEGVCTLVKKAAETWAEGDALYFDNTAKNWTKTSATGLFKAGNAAAAALSADVIGDIRLAGVPVVAAP